MCSRLEGLRMPLQQADKLAMNSINDLILLQSLAPSAAVPFEEFPCCIVENVV